MRQLLLVLALGGLAAGEPAPPSMHWSLDGEGACSAPLKPLGAGPELSPKGEGLVYDAKELPAKYIYDPQAKKSREDKGSLRVTEKGWLEAAFAAAQRPGGSFTIECFAKPAKENRRREWVLGKSRAGEGGGLAAMSFDRLGQWNQTYVSGLFATVGGGEEGGSVGHYVTSARLDQNNLWWRHLAIVYDAEAKTVSAYGDYWLSWTRKVDKPLTWDEAPLCLGGRSASDALDGWVDELRVSAQALKPAGFLRAVDSPLQGVSFESTGGLLPASSGAIDAKACFGLVGDGNTDDTKAFQKALREIGDKQPAHLFTLQLAPGTYLVSDVVQMNRFCVLQGAGRDKTVIKLVDKAAKYQNAKQPLAVLRCSSTWSRAEDSYGGGTNGSSIGLWAFDFAVDTGTGNPGAKAMEYHSNNIGGMERIDLRSGDGAGVTGLDLTFKTAGPSLIKDVSITGFDRGVHLKFQEYSQTIEDLRLKGQKQVGILNEGNIIGIRHLTSDNTVPALIGRGGNSMCVLLDSELKGGGKDAAAIESEGGLYCRAVKVAGYGASIRKKEEFWSAWNKRDKVEERPEVKGDIAEYVGDRPILPRGGEATSLKLPVENTPVVAWGDPAKDWVNIQDFAAKKNGEDWGPAIQAAIDSGAKTVLFPNSIYKVGAPVQLRGKVERLMGMCRGSIVQLDPKAGAPSLIVAEADAKRTYHIERLDIGSLLHQGAATLVIRHATPQTYRTAAGCGKLFMEDVEGCDYHFDHPQQVWVRQWNPEEHGEGPNIESAGATIWALGFKTEYDSSKLWASAGAKTEILASFIYPVVGGIPDTRPVFKNVDSSMSFVGGNAIYSAGHDLWFWDKQGEDLKETRNKDTKQAGSRFRVDLYVSRPGKP